MKLTIKKTPLSSRHSLFNAENSRTLDSAAAETSSNTISSSASKHVTTCRQQPDLYFKLILVRLEADVTFESRPKKVPAVASLC